MTTPAKEKGDTAKKVTVAEPWMVQEAPVQEDRLEGNQPQEEQPEHEQRPVKRPRRQNKPTYKLQASRDDAINEIVGGAKSWAAAPAEAPKDANLGCTKSIAKVDRKKSKPSAETNAAQADSKQNCTGKRKRAFFAFQPEKGGSSCGEGQTASTRATATTTAVSFTPPLAPAASAESIKPSARRSTKSKVVRDKTKARPVAKKKVVTKEVTRRGQKTGGARKPSSDKKKSKPVNQRKENKAPSSVGAPPTHPPKRKTASSAPTDSVGPRPRKSHASLPAKVKGYGVVGASSGKARTKRVRFCLEGMVVGTCARGETGKIGEDWTIRLLAAGLSVGGGGIHLTTDLPEDHPRMVRDDELGEGARAEGCGRTEKRSRSGRAGAASMPVTSDKVPAGRKANYSTSAAAIVGPSDRMHGNAAGVRDGGSKTAAGESPQKDEGVVAEETGKRKTQQRVETRRATTGRGAGARAAARAKAAALMGFVRLFELG